MPKVRPKRSTAWDHFKKLSENVVMCNICKRQFKYCKNTSNLNDHLRRMHPFKSVTYESESTDNVNTVDENALASQLATTSTSITNKPVIPTDTVPSASSVRIR